VGIAVEVPAALISTVVVILTISAVLSYYFIYIQSYTVFTPPSSIVCLYTTYPYVDGSIGIMVKVGNTGKSVATVKAVAIVNTPRGSYVFESIESAVPPGGIGNLSITIPATYAIGSSIAKVVVSSLEGTIAVCRG
jgi:hypothetical protein